MNIRRAPVGSLLKEKGKRSGTKPEASEDKPDPKAKTKKTRFR